MNNAKRLSDAYAKQPDSNNYKLLQLANLLFTDYQADLRSIARSRDISFAFGKTLDRYGEMVGVSRGTATDDQYRVKILNQIGACVSGGDCNSVISAVTQMLGIERSSVAIREHVAAVEVKGLKLSMLDTGYSMAEINAMILKVLPAGVNLVPPVYAGTLESVLVSQSGQQEEYRTLYRAWLEGQKALHEDGEQVGLAGSAEVPESFLTMEGSSTEYAVTGEYAGGTLGMSSK